MSVPLLSVVSKNFLLLESASLSVNASLPNMQDFRLLLW
jgi:hypothetical protein